MREKMYCTRIAFGMLLVGLRAKVGFQWGFWKKEERLGFTYRGISSARWDGMSGAPTAKAAFSIPVYHQPNLKVRLKRLCSPRQNAKVSLDQPVSFVIPSQTKALDA